MAKTITIGKFVYKHYIDRDALLDFAHNHKDGQIGCNDIARFPTADVVEVKHGYWTAHPASYECSICENEFFVEGYAEDYDAVEDYDLHYCPNCGAKMDGERKNKR